MMADLLLSLRIGATQASSFKAAFGSAQRTIAELDKTTTGLTAKQQRLGRVLGEAFAHPARNVGALNKHYVALGKAIDDIRQKQDKLNASIDRGTRLKNERGELTGSIATTAATAFGVGAFIKKTVGAYAEFESGLVDLEIQTGANSKAIQAFGASIKANANKYGLANSDLLTGVRVLTGKGMSLTAAQNLAPTVAIGAKATGSDTSDVASALYANSLFGITDSKRGLEIMNTAGKMGSFEIKDMIKWMPTLTGRAKSLGMQGEKGLGSLAARLQIATRTAGSNDEAAVNFKNYLDKITSQDTIKDFAKQGIDLPKAIKRRVAMGQDAIDASVDIVKQYIGKSNPAAAKELNAIAGMKDKNAQQAAIEQLTQRFGLGSFFQDAQATSYLLAELQNGDELTRIRNGALNNSKGSIDADAKTREKDPVWQFNQLKNKTNALLTEIGKPLGEAFAAYAPVIGQTIDKMAAWANTHPEMIKTIGSIVVGLLGFKIATLGLKLGLNLLMSPIVGVVTRVRQLRAAIAVFKGMQLLGGASKYSKVINGVGKAFKFLGDGGFKFIKLIGKGFMWLGRALLMNPIGLILTGLVIAGILIYRNWDKIAPVLKKVWAGIKVGYEWAKNKTMDLVAWFAGLPKRFIQFGSDMVNGLINGIKAKYEWVKQAIVGLGSSIKDTFTDMLGIHSPSRVFMGFGDNIAMGTAHGINQSSDKAAAASAQMAKRVVDTARSNTALAAGGSGAGFGAGQIVFSPQITINGNASQGDVQAALKLSLAEFETMLNQVQARKARRAYA